MRFLTSKTTSSLCCQETTRRSWGLCKRLAVRLSPRGGIGCEGPELSHRRRRGVDRRPGPITSNPRRRTEAGDARLRRHTLAPDRRGDAFRVLRVLEQSAGTKDNIVANNETNLEIVFRMWTSDFWLSVRRLGLLEFEDPIQFPGTLLEQSRRDDETVELIFLFIVSVGFGLRCGCIIGRSGAVVETKIRVCIR